MSVIDSHTNRHTLDKAVFRRLEKSEPLNGQLYYIHIKSCQKLNLGRIEVFEGVGRCVGGILPTKTPKNGRPSRRAKTGDYSGFSSVIVFYSTGY